MPTSPVIHRFLYSVVACAIAVGTVSSSSRLHANAGQEPQAQARAAGIAPEALGQIEALIREKDTRSPVHRKIDSQLLYELKMKTGRPIATGVDVLETDVPYAVDGHVVVDVKVDVTNALIARLTAQGIEVLWSDPVSRTLRIHISIDQVETVAALPQGAFVQPRQDAMLMRQAQPN